MKEYRVFKTVTVAMSAVVAAEDEDDAIRIATEEALDWDAMQQDEVIDEAVEQ